MCLLSKFVRSYRLSERVTGEGQEAMSGEVGGVAEHGKYVSETEDVHVRVPSTVTVGQSRTVEDCLGDRSARETETRVRAKGGALDVGDSNDDGGQRRGRRATSTTGWRSEIVSVPGLEAPHASFVFSMAWLATGKHTWKGVAANGWRRPRGRHPACLNTSAQ